MKVFTHPFTMLVSGSSNSGKSTFVLKLLKNSKLMINPLPSRVIWHYSQWQAGYESLDGVEFKLGAPSQSDIETYSNSILILDDLMSELSTLSSDLFTKHSHHLKISVVYILQNLFVQSKNQRSISLNSGYITLFKNPRDFSQAVFLARQVAPYNSKSVLEAYLDATRSPYSYLMFDFVQNTPDPLRLRTQIFPGERDYIYVQKDFDIKDLES